MGDDGSDDASDASWATYGEIATARQISRRAAIRLAQRHRWRRQAGNDAFVRVLVPRNWLAPAKPARDVAPAVIEAPVSLDAGDVALAVAAFDRSLAVMTEQLTRERDRGDRAEAVASELRAELVAVTEDLAAARLATERANALAAAAEGRAEASDQAMRTVQAAHAGEIAALRQRAGTLRDRAEDLQVQVVRLEEEGAELSAQAEATKARASRAEGELAAERIHAHTLTGHVEGYRADLEQARREAQEAAQAADALVATLTAQLAEAEAGAKRADAEAQQLARAVNDHAAADTERRAKGRWARLRAAWRGQ